VVLLGSCRVDRRGLLEKPNDDTAAKLRCENAVASAAPMAALRSNRKILDP
jgi:hypothetical protein